LNELDDMEEAEMAISWGLHQVTNGLSFLVNQGNHNQYLMSHKL